MSVIDELVAHNQRARRAPGADNAVPSRHVAVVTCMDTRINVYDALGLELGQAHIIRNAGGVVTEDVIRSLAVSQRKLQTREVMIMQHTSCGMGTITEDGFKDEVQADTGVRPPWSVEAFSDLEANVRQSLQRLRWSPFLPHLDQVRGFVFDVATGSVTEVS